MLKREISLKDPLIRAVLIVLAIAVGVYMLCQKAILQPRRGKSSELKQKLEHIKLEDEIAKLYNKVNSYEKDLAPEKDPYWLRVKITELADKADINISSIEPLPAKQFPPYTYISFRIKAACTYSGLLELIKLIESSPHIIAVENVKLNTAEDYKLEVTEKEQQEMEEPTEAKIEIVIGTIY